MLTQPWCWPPQGHLTGSVPLTTSPVLSHPHL